MTDATRDIVEDEAVVAVKTDDVVDGRLVWSSWWAGLARRALP